MDVMLCVVISNIWFASDHKHSLVVGYTWLAMGVALLVSEAVRNV